MEFLYFSLLFLVGSKIWVLKSLGSHVLDFDSFLHVADDDVSGQKKVGT